MKRNKIHVGDLVRWYDVEEDDANIFEVVKVNGDMLLIANEYTETEVFKNDVELI